MGQTGTTTTTSPGQGSLDQTNSQVDANSTGAKGIYIGVESGSDLEQYGYQANPNYGNSALARKVGGWPARQALPRKPLYKVGYMNSKDFARELGNFSPDAIYGYQQWMNQAGLLDKFSPGQLDKATRGAFKELLTRANQHAGTWQSELYGLLQAGGVVSTPTERQPFQAVLDDPASLRETFQAAAQNLYGGDLPDDEVNAMVESFRAQQLQKQKAAYDADGLGGTIDKEVDPRDFATSQIKAVHPDQVNRVKFADTLGTILSTFSSGAPK